MQLTEPQERWLKALESGSYKQGLGFLKHSNFYCCLGVACELFKQELALRETFDSSGCFKFDGEDRVLPFAVQKHLRLKTKVGHMKLHYYSSLADLNDNGKTFAEIAKFIRNNPEKVFL
jgi:hypothetical protein